VEPQVVCCNCAMPLAHEYCGHCGQRRFRPEHRRLRHLLGQFFEALTDFDSRVWRSLRALAFQPGRMTRDWFAGRRVYWMSPVALFLLANLLFFLAPAITDFDLPLRDHVSAALRQEYSDPADATAAGGVRSGQPHSRYTERWVRARLHQRAAQRREVGLDASPAATFAAQAQAYAQASASYSKLLIVLHVPFLALGLQLLLLGSRRYFAEHMAAALHFFAFVLFFVEAIVLPTELLGDALALQGEMPAWVKGLVGTLLVVHTCRMLRVAYGCTWWRALVAGVALPLLLLAINVTVYRALQFAFLFLLA